MNAAGDIRAAAPGSGLPPNQRLAQARQAQGLSTAEVARQLKLSVWQVEALESGQYQQLPGPIFVRGFIRNYARLLKLDPEELVHGVTETLPAAPELTDSPPARDIPFPAGSPRRWQRYAAGAAVVVMLLAVYEFYFSKQPATVTTETAPAEPLVAKEPQAAAPAKAPREATAKAPREAQAKPAATATATTAQVAAAAPSAASASVPQLRERAAHPEDRELRFVFEEESWVEVRDRNDQAIFSQLNRAGTTRRVVGLPPLYVVVGNAQGVRMTFDGRDIDLARHTKIDVARLTVP